MQEEENVRGEIVDTVMINLKLYSNYTSHKLYFLEFMRSCGIKWLSLSFFRFQNCHIIIKH